jgi:hypothetical protein
LQVECYKTLFSDIFLVVKTYGSVDNLKPIGIKKSVFSTKKEAKKHLVSYIKTKRNKGYKLHGKV